MFWFVIIIVALGGTILNHSLICGRHNALLESMMVRTSDTVLSLLLVQITNIKI